MYKSFWQRWWVSRAHDLNPDLFNYHDANDMQIRTFIYQRALQQVLSSNQRIPSVAPQQRIKYARRVPAVVDVIVVGVVVVDVVVSRNEIKADGERKRTREKRRGRKTHLSVLLITAVRVLATGIRQSGAPGHSCSRATRTRYPLFAVFRRSHVAYLPTSVSNCAFHVRRHVLAWHKVDITVGFVRSFSEKNVKQYTGLILILYVWPKFLY